MTPWYVSASPEGKRTPAGSNPAGSHQLGESMKQEEPSEEYPSFFWATSDKECEYYFIRNIKTDEISGPFKAGDVPALKTYKPIFNR